MVKFYYTRNCRVRDKGILKIAELPLYNLLTCFLCLLADRLSASGSRDMYIKKVDSGQLHIYIY